MIYKLQVLWLCRVPWFTTKYTFSNLPIQRVDKWRFRQGLLKDPWLLSTDIFEDGIFRDDGVTMFVNKTITFNQEQTDSTKNVNGAKRVTQNQQTFLPDFLPLQCSFRE